ncbi:MAG TPA: DUF4126 domain-containing protein [Thermoanaerobaculia bacterium]|nr:DUF4126 domain-containing protein [Thermoanaerobaculia bacterium]
MIESVGAILTSVGLGVGAGVNAYATFLVFGLISRFYPGVFSGTLADFFASTPVLIVLGILYLIEFVADKIPAVDHAWDVIHTFVRPLAGAVVAFAAATPELPQGVAILAGVLGGSAALGSHVIKSSVRATSTVTTGGTANPVLSVAEDVFAIVQSILAVFLPYVFLAALILFLAIMSIWFMRASRRSALP